MKIKNSCDMDCMHCKHQCYRALHTTSIDRIRKETAESQQLSATK